MNILFSDDFIKFEVESCLSRYGDFLIQVLILVLGKGWEWEEAPINWIAAQEALWGLTQRLAKLGPSQTLFMRFHFRRF